MPSLSRGQLRAANSRHLRKPPQARVWRRITIWGRIEGGRLYQSELRLSQPESAKESGRLGMTQKALLCSARLQTVDQGIKASRHQGNLTLCASLTVLVSCLLLARQYQIDVYFPMSIGDRTRCQIVSLGSYPPPQKRRAPDPANNRLFSISAIRRSIRTTLSDDVAADGREYDKDLLPVSQAMQYPRMCWCLSSQICWRPPTASRLQYPASVVWSIMLRGR